MAEIRISRPSAYTKARVYPIHADRMVFDFPLQEATVSQQGNSLVLTFIDGATLTLQNFFHIYKSESEVPLFVSGGVEVSGGAYLSLRGVKDFAEGENRDLPGGNGSNETVVPTQEEVTNLAESAMSDQGEGELLVSAESTGGEGEEAESELTGLEAILSALRSRAMLLGLTAEDARDILSNVFHDVPGFDAGSHLPGGLPSADNGIALVGAPASLDVDVPVAGGSLFGDNAENTVLVDVLRVDERNLSTDGDAVTASGTVQLSVPEGVATVEVEGVVVYGPDGLVEENGEPVRVPTDFGSMQVTGVDTESGEISYTFTLERGSDLHGTADTDDSFAVGVTVTVTDTADSVFSAGVAVVVDDDAPTLPDLSVTPAPMVSGQELRGTFDVDFGADSEGAALSIQLDGETVEGTANDHGTLTYDLAFGELDLDPESGDYVYTADPFGPDTAAAKEVFTLVATDADGDSASTEVVFEVAPPAVPEVTGSLSVSEAGLVAAADPADPDAASASAVWTAPEGWTVTGVAGAALGSVVTSDTGFTYELDGAADHSAGPVSETLDVLLTDANGNTCRVQVSVDIADDTPEAGPAISATVVAGDGLAGSFDPDYGADGPAKDSGDTAGGLHIVQNSETVHGTVNEDGTISFVLANGTLTVDRETGAYTYEAGPFGADTESAKETFELVATDSDGDTASTEVTFDITRPDAPEITGSMSVSEAGLGGDTSLSEATWTAPEGWTLAGISGAIHGNLVPTENGFTYVLKEAVDHSAGPVSDPLEVLLTDANGNTCRLQVSVDITDDAPEFGLTAPVSVVSGEEITGDFDLDYGADGAAAGSSSLHVVQNGQTVQGTVNEDGSITFALAYGTLTVDPATGAYTYKANPFGEDTDSAQEAFELVATDSDGDTASTPVSIDIKHPGTPAVTGSLTVSEEGLSDPDATVSSEAVWTAPEGWTVTEVTGGSYGTVVLTEDGFTYTLKGAVDHTDGPVTETLNVLATDADGNTHSVEVTVDIADDAPTLTGEVAPTVVSGAALTGSFDLDFGADRAEPDPEDYPGGLYVVQNGTTVYGTWNQDGTIAFALANGTLTVNRETGDYTYRANVLGEGVASAQERFELVAKDSDGDTATLPVTIDVTPPAPPSFTNTLTVYEAGLNNPDDSSSAQATWVAPEGWSVTGIHVVYGYVINNTENGFTYVLEQLADHTQGDIVIAPLTVTLKDGYGNTRVVQVNVNIVDDAPSLAENYAGDIVSGGSLVGAFDLDFGADGPAPNNGNVPGGIHVVLNGETIQGTLNEDGRVSFELAYGTLTVSRETGDFTYVANRLEEGAETAVESFDLVATDADGDTAATHVTIDVNPPVMPDFTASLTVNEEDLRGSDASAEAVWTAPEGWTVTGVTGAGHGSIETSDSGFTYVLTDAVDHSGGAVSDTLDVVLTDAYGNSFTVQVNVDITDDAPSLPDSLTTGLTAGYGLSGSFDLDYGADGPEPDPEDYPGGLYVVQNGSTVYGTLNPNGTISFALSLGTLTVNRETGDFTYTANPFTSSQVDSAQEIFELVAVDGDGDSKSTDVTFNINRPALPAYTENLDVSEAGLNDPDAPVPSSVVWTVPDGWKVNGVPASSHVNVHVSGDGSTVTFTLNGPADHLGDPVTETLNVYLEDAAGNIVIAPVTVNIVDDLPSIDDFHPGSVASGGELTGSFALDFGADGPADASSLYVNQNGVHIEGTVNGDGTLTFALANGDLVIDPKACTYTYRADPMAPAGQEIFTLVAVDGDNDSASRAVTINVTESEPEAPALSTSSEVNDASSTVEIVLEDLDLGGDVTPPEESTGPAAIEITVTDGTGVTSTWTIHVNTNPIGDYIFTPQPDEAGNPCPFSIETREDGSHLLVHTRPTASVGDDVADQLTYVVTLVDADGDRAEASPITVNTVVDGTGEGPSGPGPAFTDFGDLSIGNDPSTQGTIFTDMFEVDFGAAGKPDQDAFNLLVNGVEVSKMDMGPTVNFYTEYGDIYLYTRDEGSYELKYVPSTFNQGLVEFTLQLSATDGEGNTSTTAVYNFTYNTDDNMWSFLPVEDTASLADPASLDILGDLEGAYAILADDIVVNDPLPEEKLSVDDHSDDGLTGDGLSGVTDPSTFSTPDEPIAGSDLIARGQPDPDGQENGADDTFSLDGLKTFVESFGIATTEDGTLTVAQAAPEEHAEKAPVATDLTDMAQVARDLGFTTDLSHPANEADTSAAPQPDATALVAPTPHIAASYDAVAGNVADTSNDNLAPGSGEANQAAYLLNNTMG